MLAPYDYFSASVNWLTHLCAEEEATLLLTVQGVCVEHRLYVVSGRAGDHDVVSYVYATVLQSGSFDAVKRSANEIKDLPAWKAIEASGPVRLSVEFGAQQWVLETAQESIRAEEIA